MRIKALVWILRPGPEVLLLERPARRGGGEHPVTGKGDPGETPLECAAREAREETGLTGMPEPLGIVHRFQARKHVYEEHCFLLRVEAGAEPVLSDEHVAWRWVAPEVARAAVQWPAHRESLEKALALFA